MTTVGRAPSDRRRPRTALVPAAACAAAALLLSGCSNGGSSLAQAACVHVDASIRLYTQSEHATSAARAREKVDQATAQLDQALQLAARATSANPAFNPLMTTLQEIGRTSEKNLVSALRAQCAAANHPTAQSPVPGGPTPGTVPAGAPGGG
ncbi:MAG TPA: hypothetical protein VND62_04985 [Acidimicrobiales bacterium]|nr:hypothetical protein [Acidimicrobiales bacterium]